VYSVVKALRKRGLIKSTKTKSAKAPYKVNYSITPKGREMLKSSLLYYLEEPGDPFSEVTTPLTILGYLLSVKEIDKATALKTLKKYLTILKREMAVGNQIASIEKDLDSADYYQIYLDCSQKILKNCIATINKFIKKMNTETEWPYYPIPFWRREMIIGEKESSTGKKGKKGR
jgi:DNA-binding PadR family transcriptional regulator